MTEVNEMSTLRFKVAVVIAMLGMALLAWLILTSGNSEKTAEASVVIDQCVQAETFLKRAIQLQGVAKNIQKENADEERRLRGLFKDMLRQERSYYHVSSSPLGSLDQDLINGAQGQEGRGKQLQHMAEQMQVNAQQLVDKHCDQHPEGER